jgi:hypothetical protein
MAFRLRPQTLVTLACLLAAACSGSKDNGKNGNSDNGPLADDLGTFLDANGDGVADTVDINKDGKPDGPGVDLDGDGKGDGLALDCDGDGIFDAVDNSGDGKPDRITATETVDVASCKPGLAPATGTGGSSGMGGSTGMAGSPPKGGSGTGGSGGGGGGMAPSQLGKGIYQGTGTSSDQYAESDVYRDGVGYKFIANGWGDKWQSHNITWNGTSFGVLSLQGSQGDDYSPAGYPTMFCGFYSMKQSIGSCGLPGAVTSLQSVRTGWRWKANGNSGQYNAAWDIWLGNGNQLSAYLMVWLREPPGQQPAGAAALSGATIQGLPGSWTIWTGNVKGIPIVNYVKPEGQDLSELEFDVMDVYRDAKMRNFNLPGSNIIAVAVGFEVWNGPITNLQTEDFYVTVK